jgi:trans-aconitate 2-methyltransferase
VVSFNALHWIPEQSQALRSIRSALKPGGVAQLRLVPAGQKKSLETVIEETRLSSRWARHFGKFRDPYLRLTPQEYGALAERCGLRMRRTHTATKTWDFRTRAAFVAFGSVTFVEWTQFVPADERLVFVNDVLDRYRVVASEGSGEDDCFKFYQMDVTLSPI